MWVSFVGGGIQILEPLRVASQDVQNRKLESEMELRLQYRHSKQDTGIVTNAAPKASPSSPLLIHEFCYVLCILYVTVHFKETI